MCWVLLLFCGKVQFLLKKNKKALFQSYLDLKVPHLPLVTKAVFTNSTPKYSTLCIGIGRTSLALLGRVGH